MIDLSTATRKVVFVSALAATVVAILSVADLFLGYPFDPFRNTILIDVTFLIGAALTLYMAYDTWQELPPGATRRSGSSHSELPNAQTRSFPTRSSSRAAYRGNLQQRIGGTRKPAARWRDVSVTAAQKPREKPETTTSA